MSKIEKLRAVGKVKDEWTSSDIYEEITDILDSLGVSEVYSEFKNGGRWTNLEIKVYEVIEGENMAHFRLEEQVPATEIQEDGDFVFSFYEVEPYEKTIIAYRMKDFEPEEN